MKYISDRLPSPNEANLVISWESLTSKSRNTLWRAIERSDIQEKELQQGFSFDILRRISINDLYDARQIGQVRAEKLIQELISIFSNLNANRETQVTQRSQSRFPTKVELDAMRAVNFVPRSPGSHSGPRRFPTKAELEAMRAVKGLPDSPGSHSGPRRFPTKAELEAMRAVKGLPDSPGSHSGPRRFPTKREFEELKADTHHSTRLNNAEITENNFKEFELDARAKTILQLASTTSTAILEKLKVDEKVQEYIFRTNSIPTLTHKKKRLLVNELQPSNNPFKRIMLGKRSREEALEHLIESNLRLSLAFANRMFPDQDLRTRVLAGNLGLLAGLTSFSHKSNHELETHIIKYIREYIEHFVGTLKFSYESILNLILEENRHELAVDVEEQKAASEDLFGNCTTFVELFEILERELLKLPKVDERALAILKHRHQAFGEPGLTLDEIGRKWGITRERVRQIVDPLMNITVQSADEAPPLLRAVELFEECEDEEQFKSKVAQDEIFSGEDFSWQRLWGLTRIMSPKVLAKRVYEKHLALEAESGTNSPIRNLIKKDRSKFGLYDLQVVAKKHKLSEDKAFKIISELYPRSIRSGSLVLARTKNLDSMFENSIAKQLKVSSPLEVKDLLKGLQRTSKYRDVTLVGTVTELTNLILNLAGDPPNYEKISSGLIKEVEFQALEKWLIEIFSEANLGILHSNDVVNFALRDRRINISSITVYLLNSPIMRSHGRSLYSLVGTEVAKDQLDAYTQIIRGTSEASEVSYEITDAFKGILSVKPNLNVITSGIVFPPSGYKKIFEGVEFATSCACGLLETIQAVKFAPSGFWTGFTAMIRHGFSQHEMSRESTFRFEFDFNQSVVRLLVN